MRGPEISIDSVESGGWYRCIHYWDHCNNRTDNHAGHFIYQMGVISGQFLADPTPAYAFSKPLDWLGFDPSYPKNPLTFGDYIRKWRMQQGISQVSLAEKLGVNEMTIVNWEIKGMLPARRHLERITREVEGVGKFL